MICKFECLSSCIVIITANILDNIIQANSRAKGPKKPRIIFIRLFELTKGGKMLFTIILLYLFFVSITLPVIQYYIIRKSMNKEFKNIKKIKKKKINKKKKKKNKIFFFFYILVIYIKINKNIYLNIYIYIIFNIIY